MERILDALHTLSHKKEFLYCIVAVLGGVVSFILAEDNKSFRSFSAEIIMAVFVGLFIASPIAQYAQWGDSLSTAFIAIMAVTGRRFILFIKDNYSCLLEGITNKIFK